MSHFFRLAQRQDLPVVKDIVRRAYSPYISLIGREPGPMSDDYDALIKDGRVQLIEHEGGTRGLLVLIPREETMLLDNVAIDPVAQGSGLGRRLIEHAEQAARKAGYRSIELYTNEAMVENISWYSRVGYRETRRVEEKGLKRVYMVKELA